MRKLWTSERKAEAFLTSLARREVAAATENQALNAIAFLHREVLCTSLGTVDALRRKFPARVAGGACAEISAGPISGRVGLGRTNCRTPK